MPEDQSKTRPAPGLKEAFNFEKQSQSTEEKTQEAEEKEAPTVLVIVPDENEPILKLKGFDGVVKRFGPSRRCLIKSIVRVVQINHPFKLKVGGNVTEATSGSYLCQTQDGDLYVISDGEFATRYQPV